MILGGHGARITGLALVLAAVASCGEQVRLGDAILGDATTDGTGGSDGDGDGSTEDRPGSGGADGDAACGSGRVNPNAVVWIGDSWGDHSRHPAHASEGSRPRIGCHWFERRVRRARSTEHQHVGDCGSVQRSRSWSDPGSNSDHGRRGTWDTLTAGGTDSSVAKAVGGFKQLLATAESDGTVQNIIYFLQPELPAIVGVAALRPQLRQACSDSAVPCYFIDLQPLWVGHPEYTAGDGIQASTAGATVIADQIWATLRQHCIAQ